jgi:two-component system, OmpR family, response regulator
MPINILVVDDNRIYRESFCTLLQDCFAHAQIVAVCDGISALGMTYKIPFDLIILDYELTTISGSDIVRRLRARGRPLPPIVFMSAHPDIAVFARLNMVDAYLHKPVSLDDMQAVLAPLVDGSVMQTIGPNVWRPIEAPHPA